MRALLLGVLITRQSFDLCTDQSVAGIPMNQLGTLALMCACVIIIRRGERPPTDLARPALAFGATIIIAALHATSPQAALRHGLLLASPILVGWAAWSSRVRPVEVVQAVCVGSVIPIGTSLALLAAGQQHALVAHGYPRLVGLYANHHTLGLTAGLTALFAAALACQSPRPLVRGAAALLTAGALIVAGATWVRTVVLLWVVSGLTWLILERRWRTLTAAVVVATGVLFWAPPVRDRLSDVVALLTLSAPDAGWSSLGSSRPAIWRDALTAFAGHGPLVWLSGLGLGGHLELWAKPLDPHCEPLALWFQLGLLGPVAWGLWHAAAGLRIARGDSPWRTSALALLAGALATCLVSNTFVARPTLGWSLWALLAATARSKH